jgi:hypothetical protein
MTQPLLLLTPSSSQEVQRFFVDIARWENRFSMLEGVIAVYLNSSELMS